MNPWLTCAGLAFILVALAKLLEGKATRWLIWMSLALAIYTMHAIALTEPAILRMLWLCTVLMAGMKWLVYHEWSSHGGTQKRTLPWKRWLLFCTWFGMNPTVWSLKRAPRTWRPHLYIGALYLGIGIAGITLCCLLDVNHVIPLFISMSLIMHFGVLRLGTAFWRMIGFPTRALFRNPLAMRGFRDFWGKRWNLGYSHMMALTVQKPTQRTLGEKGSVLAVFLVSGILHEVAITLPMQTGYGLPTLFFLAHGIGTLLETKNNLYTALICAILLLIGLPYLFNPTFQQQVIIPCKEAWGYITMSN